MVTRLEALAARPGAVWYRDGLRFECTKCGQCCRGTNGYVWVGEAEISRMAEAKGLALDDFGKLYLRKVATRYALLDTPASGDCIFLEDNECSIHAARPDQCRRYPWWPVNLGSESAWREAAKQCEGIRDDAVLVAREEIDDQRYGCRTDARASDERRPAGVMRTVYVLLATIASTLAISIPTIYEFSRAKLRREVVDRRLRRWARRVLALAAARVSVSDPYDAFSDGDRPTIVMSNHGSLYDIPLLFDSLPGTIRMLTKKELFDIPIWGRAMKAAEFVSVDRHDHQRALHDLEVARRQMIGGITLWVAPEGTRNNNGRLNPFKKGGFMVALQTGARIIPVGIRGAGDILPPKTFMDLRLGCRVEVAVGRPIDAQEYCEETRDELIETVYASIARLSKLSTDHSRSSSS